MSGIEAFAVAGVAANLLQLIDYSKKIYDRLEQYHASANGLPEAFVHVKAKLGVLSIVLRNVEKAVNTGIIPEDEKVPMREVLGNCYGQIKQLEDIMSKALPRPDMSGLKRNWKAIRSLKYDRKLERITKNLESYQSSITMKASTTVYQDMAAPAPPSPSSNVPFRQDPNFVDRVAITSQIHDKCQKPASRVALVGIGGVGKSQLAVEYSYRLRARSPQKWVFWIHAGSTADIHKGFANIAGKAHIHAWDPKDPGRFQVVSNWLADEANGTWLIIIDNADDLKVFQPEAEQIPTVKKGNKHDDITNSATEDLLNLFPESPNSSYLITSRNRSVAYRITGDHNDIIDVDPMQEDESIMLLRKRVKDIVADEDAMALVAALDYMPLAITQASAYINENRPRVTVKKYIEKLREGDNNRAKLLEESVHDARRDGRRSNSIIATWYISFDSIMRTRLSAARLIALMSLFYCNGIPESLLLDYYEAEPGIPIPQKVLPNTLWKRAYLRFSNSKRYELEKEILNFDDDWRMLTSYCLIATDIDGVLFSMHPLVQFATRKWLEYQDELQYWKEVYVNLLNLHYPWPTLENTDVVHSLLTHAGAAAQYLPLSEPTLVAWASLMHKLAQFYCRINFCPTAEMLNRIALQIMEHLLGTDHLETLQCITSLGETLSKAEKYEEAVSLYRRVYNARKRIHGMEHLDTIESAKVLSLALYRLGQIDESDAMELEARHAKTKLLGADHPEVKMDLGVSSVGLLMSGRAHNAEERLRIYDDPQTSSNVAFLGVMSSALESQSRFSEAESIRRRALAITESQEGDEESANANGQLARCLEMQAKYDEAEPVYRRTFEISRTRFGDRGSFTLDALNDLARCLLKQENIEEAEMCARKVIEATQTDMEDADGRLWWAMRTLAIVLRCQQKHEESRYLFDSACMRYTKQKGQEDPGVKEFVCDYEALEEHMFPGEAKAAEAVMKAKRELLDTLAKLVPPVTGIGDEVECCSPTKEPVNNAAEVIEAIGEDPQSLQDRLVNSRIMVAE